MKRRNFLLLGLLALALMPARAMDNKGISFPELSSDRFTLIENGTPVTILADESDKPGVQIALKALQKDFKAVAGQEAGIIYEPAGGKIVIAGTLESKYISQIVKSKKIDRKQLQGKTEKYIMTVIEKPIKGVDEALVIAGSDMRGTIYGIYELSEQIGVSPWYFWADVPIQPQKNISLAKGTYTAGEPAVRYRGIFLNDEAPCLTSWVKNYFGTDRGGKDFYASCFELILRLRGNFMWPAMWGWAFYADDPENSKTANDMGVIMGTSHHEPMARNHQEWARNPRAYGGVWDYTKNKEELQRFFREGIERAKDTEDLITIGMRGDGDAELKGTDEEIIKMMEGLFVDQRQIIKDVTGKKPEQVPQVWALYKEVQNYYNKGLRVPDDVTILLSDDNWGDIRRLPNEEEQKHPGGWGMYYHVDYVGAPRNSKWLNITPIQHMWEAMQLTYDYNVKKLWVLNVGDLKPMEYPITLFLDMAWDPTKFTAENLLDHTYDFCVEFFGEDQAKEAARILNLCSKYNGRISAEMLDARQYYTVDEFRQVCGDYARLELEAMRQYETLAPEYRDAYQQIILFPVQAMANIYDMYYSQAMNNQLARLGDPAANEWADRCEADFKRDAKLNAYYNTEIAGGKWNGMMTQKHIGYTSWNDNFRADTQPRVTRVEEARTGGCVFTEKNGVVSMEAEHYFSQTGVTSGSAEWKTIPYMGRTLSGVALMPYSQPTDGASMTYKFNTKTDADNLKAIIAVNATLTFKRLEGHRYMVSLDGGKEIEVVFNERLNEDQRNIYSVYYPTVATRVKDDTVELGAVKAGEHTLTIRPIEPGTVFEKIVIDNGGYVKSFLFMDESPYTRQ
ncbi:MAG: glycosyl hydrolase 115 family protein [Bacteroidaceae bacterium]|nr:glycosyl hydrolase 115 family protein [Bacteroidaceae bacterium]